MEEIVALDSSKQKQFVKSIKGIKKKLVKKNETLDSKNIVADENKDGKPKKRKIKERGLVYLAHIPHGFYENEMTQYFKQFGMVTNVRVIRSKQTGNSKGYAFVEFKEPTVAQIVAETMNNYLMGKRLLKAAYIPPEKQRQRAMRKKWNPTHNPGRDAMLKQKKAYNAVKDDSQDLEIAKKTLSNINKTKEKLRALGIDYDFFTPVDVPEGLSSLVNVDQEKSKAKAKKEKVAEAKVHTKNAGKNESKVIQKGSEKTASKKDGKVNVKEAKNKKVLSETKVDTKQQKQKQQKLKEKGVTPAENFIKVQEESGDESDSSLDFDSDEYEKLMDSEEDSLGSEEEESDSDGGSDEDSNEEDSEESEKDEVPKMPLVINPNKLKKQEKKQKAPLPQMKRKAVPAAPAPNKKSKFEKQQKTPQFAKKQFNKKK